MIPDTKYLWPLAEWTRGAEIVRQNCHIFCDLFAFSLLLLEFHLFCLHGKTFFGQWVFKKKSFTKILSSMQKKNVTLIWQIYNFFPCHLTWYDNKWGLSISGHVMKSNNIGSNLCCECVFVWFSLDFYHVLSR